MKRRDLLSGSGVFSLIVFADKLAPAAVQPTGEQVRLKFNRLTPSGAARAAAEPNMKLVDLDADVLVAGGGVAGVCAAIAAARHGARVVLLQDRSRLGGNSSSEVKMHVIGASNFDRRPGWRESGLIEEFRLEDAVNNPQHCFELWDLLLYDKVVSEPNVTLLLETTLYAATREGDRITEVLARCDKTEHLYRIRAKIFCDCTGDSRLGLEAGADMRRGREARSEYNESLAVEKADGETLGSSILFSARDYGRPMPFRPPNWARKVTEEHLRMRRIESWEYGYWWIAWGGDHDTIADNQRIRFELLSIVLGVWDYIKNSGKYPTSANWAIDWLGMTPGKRGSRRMLGDAVVTQNDILRGEFEDAVAIGGWTMDDHPPGGFDRSDEPPQHTVRTPVYSIPLRALYSRNVSNLMMAGRNISCSHVAFTSSRVMATCSVVGQAAGTAAAACVRRGVFPRQLYQRKELLRELQQTLLRDDQTVKNRVNEDPADFARTARVTASAEAPGAPAALVIDGHLRDYPAGDQVEYPVKNGKPEVHHWQAPMGGEGAWIELSWDKPRKISELQLTFDSGFQRDLLCTLQASKTKGIIRAAQPEIVRDYSVSCRPAAGGQLKQFIAVTGNHQRLNRHRFAPIEATAIRVHVKATNGDPDARIFEIRCYA